MSKKDYISTPFDLSENKENTFQINATKGLNELIYLAKEIECEALKNAVQTGSQNEEHQLCLSSSHEKIIKTVVYTETLIYKMCNSLLQLYAQCEDLYPIELVEVELEMKKKNIPKLVEVVAHTSNFFAVRSPVLHRSFLTKLTTPCYRAHSLKVLFDAAIDPVPYQNGIYIYTCTIYPEGTDSSLTIDTDNLNHKAMTDPICSLLEIDDNGMDVCSIWGCATSSKLIPGTYTVVTPKTEPIKTINQIAKLLENC